MRFASPWGIHIDHKLYETNKVKICPNCGQEISVTESEGEAVSDGQKATKETYCHQCGDEVLVAFERVKPEWVELVIGQESYKAESIQTCNAPWCQQEFLIQWAKIYVEDERFEESYVPVACPHCYQEHWITLYEIE